MITPFIESMEDKINKAGSNAMADYNRAVILYQNGVVPKQEFIRISTTISQILIHAIEGITAEAGDNNV